jgi:hypothetical protein
MKTYTEAKRDDGIVFAWRSEYICNGSDLKRGTAEIVFAPRPIVSRLIATLERGENHESTGVILALSYEGTEPRAVLPSSMNLIASCKIAFHGKLPVHVSDFDVVCRYAF